MLIKEKVAIVTGGSSGLGEATVEGLVARGAKVGIFDLKAPSGQSVSIELGNRVEYFEVDVTDENSVKSGIEKTRKAFGGFHICVNCAGISPASKTIGKSGPHPIEVFRKVIDVNLNGTFNVLRLAASEMAKNEPLNDSAERGVIVNTASTAAFEGQVGQAAYAASKAGICGMTLAIARDLSPLGIRIMTVAPGLFLTAMAKSLPQKVLDGLNEMIEFPKRLGNPSEYADLVAHLIENAYFNGEVVRLDAAIRARPR